MALPRGLEVEYALIPADGNGPPACQSDNYRLTRCGEVVKYFDTITDVARYLLATERLGADDDLTKLREPFPA